MKTRKLKIVVEDLDLTKLEEVKKRNIRKAQMFFASCPFATKVYVSMKTKLPMSFIINNWEEIISVA